MKGRELYHTLRLLVTGRESGAPIALILSCLGRERVMERLAERSQDR
ncbi:MAG: hypothetical protein LBQ56_04390 [Synergistaceae bacterium]|nr:hypothetical protein [Synergistaceae bacterium]